MKITTKQYPIWIIYFSWFVLVDAGFPTWIQAQVATPTANIESAAHEAALVNTMDTAAGMNLFNLLAAGGWVMFILAILSVLTVGLAIYYGIMMREKNLLPHDVVSQIRDYLQDQRYEDIGRLCRRSKGMLSKVILAGVVRGTQDPKAAADTMEVVGRREGEALMRRVRYLSDIATVAPMLGLLGTVLGMINAFNFIAFDISAVKPVAMASAVAQALITTAAGLIVAIPSMGFFFYFRGKLQSLLGQMEEVATEVSDQFGLLESQQEAHRKHKRSSEL